MSTRLSKTQENVLRIIWSESERNAKLGNPKGARLDGYDVTIRSLVRKGLAEEALTRKKTWNLGGGTCTSDGGHEFIRLTREGKRLTIFND